MPSEEDIDNQQALLAVHRRNLAHLLIQLASYGGKKHAPLYLINSIDEIQASISEVKKTLHCWGVTIENLPGEIELSFSQISPDLSSSSNVVPILQHINQYPLHLTVVLNIIIFILLIVFNLILLNTSSVYFVKDSFSLSCVDPLASSASLSIFFWACAHISWNYLKSFTESADNNINLRYFTISIKTLFVLFNMIHPRRLSNLALGITACVLFVVAAVIGINHFSPFRVTDEPPPIIKSFFVEYFDDPSRSESLKRGDVLLIATNQPVRVTPVLTDAINTRCTWSTSNGTLSPAKRCSIIYSKLSSQKEPDNLIVLVESECGTYQLYSDLQIKVIQTPPK